MAVISVLDQTTINQIAAGEVIERPASVVKELLENAIDAQATAVTVEIREGGCSLIRITDNGCGIPKEEIPTAFLRHATSKIRSADDLTTVASLGFRGEALASIAAVSQVEMISKTADRLTGTRYQIEGGTERGIEEVGAPEGTTIIARNLFFNTPVRKKFLKTPMTEGTHVAAVVEKIALSHPDISIRLIQNNQNKLYTSGNNNLKDLIYTVFGREITSNLLSVDAVYEGIHITGFIGKPVIARSNRNYENYFVNGRYVRSNIISKAIEEAYKPYMMQHKYPFTMLHLSIDPETLDVNVHPTKMELRFSDGEYVFNRTLEAVGEALAHKELIPQVTLDEAAKKRREERQPRQPEPFEIRRQSSLDAGNLSSGNRSSSSGSNPVFQETASAQRSGVSRPSLLCEEAPGWKHVDKKDLPANESAECEKKTQTVFQTKQTEDAGRALNPPAAAAPISRSSVPASQAAEPMQQLELFDGKLLDPKSRLKHRLIGQLFDTYWMVEYNDQLYIIDQHAAHEKVLYEKTVRSLKDRQYDSQLVNPPVILTLNQGEALLLEQYLEYFKGIGFEIEPFGGREYAVRAVPANLFSIAKKELLIEMIDGLSEDMSVHNPDIIYEKIASMSCKAAVKGRHAMSAAEADRLIDQLLELENPYACPHGRPTIISMSRYELEKKFKRIV
ncbi:MAG: DNA mismatch repair endonuclease MutL [Clostridium sp.]